METTTPTPQAATLITLVCQQLAAAHLPVQRVVVSGGSTTTVTGLEYVLEDIKGAGRIWLETADDHWVQLHVAYGWDSLEDCSSGVDDLIAPIWRYAAQQQLRWDGRIAAVPERVCQAAQPNLFDRYDYECPHCMGTGMHTLNPDEEPGCLCAAELAITWGQKPA